GSYADAAASRGNGPNACCVQLLPFHSHVSTPADMTVQARARSYAIPLLLGDGGLAAGRRCAQLVPSHSQVSLSSAQPASSPPNNTVWPRRTANAIAWLLRTGGLWAGNRAVQLLPSHSQVSPNTGQSAPLEPPNRTVRPRSMSNASACE